MIDHSLFRLKHQLMKQIFHKMIEIRRTLQERQWEKAKYALI